MKNINAVIIDDEYDNIEVLTLLLKQHCPHVSVLAYALNSEQGKQLLITFKPDLVFLDIEMPGQNGIEFLSQIPERNFHTIIVTAYTNYAIDAIKLAALDYILKPIVLTWYSPI